MTPVVLVLAAAAVVVFLLVRARFWPLGPCPRCTRKGRGKAGRSFGSGGQAWARCGRCGGSGERIRPLAQVWPQHRQAARKRKQEQEEEMSEPTRLRWWLTVPHDTKRFVWACEACGRIRIRRVTAEACCDTTPGLRRPPPGGGQDCP